MRHAKVGGIQNLFLQFVAQLFQHGLELGVASPFPHVDDVLNDNPAGLECLGKPHDLKRGVLALFAPGLVTLGRAVVGAFRGGEDEINLSVFFGERVNILFLQPPGNKFGFGEIGVVGFPGQRPEVKGSNNLNARFTRAPTAAAGSAK